MPMSVLRSRSRRELGRLSIRLPARCTSPESGASSSPIRCRSVLFPEPLWPIDRDESRRRDLEVDAAQHLERPAAGAVGLADAAYLEERGPRPIAFTVGVNHDAAPPRDGAVRPAGPAARSSRHRDPDRASDDPGHRPRVNDRGDAEEVVNRGIEDPFPGAPFDEHADAVDVPGDPEAEGEPGAGTDQPEEQAVAEEDPCHA
jgi:hypothetical protein